MAEAVREYESDTCDRNFVFSALSSDSIVGAVWQFKVTSKCINTITIEKNHRVAVYNCKLDYTFHGTYKLEKNLLSIVYKDDSHSEDGGKTRGKWVFRKERYLIKNKDLYYVPANRSTTAAKVPDYTRVK